MGPRRHRGRARPRSRGGRRGADLVRRCSGPGCAARSAATAGRPGMTMTRPLRREDGLLDPTRPAVELERQVRALRRGRALRRVDRRAGSAVLEATADGPADRPGSVAGRLGPDGLSSRPPTAGSCCTRCSRPGGRPMSLGEGCSVAAAGAPGEHRHRRPRLAWSARCPAPPPTPLRRRSPAGDGGPAAGPVRRRARALRAWLVERGQPAYRARQLSDALWGGTCGPRPRSGRSRRTCGRSSTPRSASTP